MGIGIGARIGGLLVLCIVIGMLILFSDGGVSRSMLYLLSLLMPLGLQVELSNESRVLSELDGETKSAEMHHRPSAWYEIE